MYRCFIKTIKHFCHAEILYLLMTDIYSRTHRELEVAKSTKFNKLSTL